MFFIVLENPESMHLKLSLRIKPNAKGSRKKVPFLVAPGKGGKGLATKKREFFYTFCLICSQS